MKPIVSNKTRSELVEYLSGFVLREIERECEAVGISPNLSYSPPPSGQRRTLARQCLNPLDLSREDDARRFLALAENLLVSAGAGSSFPASFVPWLRKDGFLFEEGRIRNVANVSSLSRVRTIAVELDAGHMHEQIERMSASVESDPALAIGSAKELVETCCKTILAERGKPATGKEDLLDLVKAVRVELKLVPDDVPNAAKGAETIKRLLSNLGTVVQGLAELRGLYGTGHGRDGKASSPLQKRP